MAHTGDGRSPAAGRAPQPGSEPTIPSDLLVSRGLSSQDALLSGTFPTRMLLPLRGLDELCRAACHYGGFSWSPARDAVEAAPQQPWQRSVPGPPCSSGKGHTPTLQFFILASCFCPRPEPSKENKLSLQCLRKAARHGAARCLSPLFCFSLKKHKILTFTKSCLLKSKGG